MKLSVKPAMLNRLFYLARFTLRAARYFGGFRHLAYATWSIYRTEGWTGIQRRLPLRGHAAVEAARFRREYVARTLVHGTFPQLIPRGAIAVVSHVFYPELFREMASYLENIPWAFDLFISVTTEQARVDIESRASKIPLVRNLDIRIVPNRGRDIAPLLVDFAADVRSHRYVLHIHTKKSLYSGLERTEWRDYLLRGLLGSEQRIRHIFNQFDTNELIGIIYPDTFSGLPYWAHTWLQNRAIALNLGDRLGIDIRFVNYVDSPTGSMFWARSDALRPLLDLRLGYADFPEEQGQTDGTLSHALERFFVISANQVGFNQRVTLDSENGGTLFLSPGRKNLDQYFAIGLKERIAYSARKAQIISFDIFDTLLTRPWFSPENVFDFLGDTVRRRFAIDNYALLRRDAERLARQRASNADAGIGEIYEEFANLIGNKDQAAAIRKLEEEAELEMLAPNTEVCETARALAASGKRLVIVSDMYLEEAFLRTILRKNAIDFFDAIYVSNVLGKRKDNGAMWRDLPLRERVGSNQWVHVGDNEHSDLQRPLDAGFAPPVHVMRAADQFRLFNEEAADWIRPIHWQEGLLLGLLANRIFLKGRACSPIILDAANRSVTITSLRDFGYLVIGPALTAFMAWLIPEARRSNISILLYASREGYLLKQAHDLIASRRGDHSAGNFPEGAYFLCSRATACLAAVTDAASIDILLDGGFKGSLADLLQLRFGINDMSPFLARLGEDCLMRPGQFPADRARYRDSLRKCLDFLTGRAALERERYRRYAYPVIGRHRAAIVDIGYGATIQQALATFLDGIIGGFYFVTTDKAHRVKAYGQFAKGCFGDSVNEFHTDLPIYKYSLLLEAVLTAPHGQLLGFDATGNPRYKENELAQKHFGQIEEIHRGALEFLNDSLAITGESFEAIGEHHAAAQLPIFQIMKSRWKFTWDPELFHVEDGYTGKEEISIFDFYSQNA